MNVKKAIKRIAALAAGTTMVTATIMGAMAYDLSDYPEPFVKNGVFNGKLVIGRTAYVSDVIGAIDVAASLQAAAVTPVSASGSTSVVSVTGGVQIKSSSTDLHYGDSIDSVNLGTYDADEFPELLADGIVEADDGTEYDYEQSIVVPPATIGYNKDKKYGDDPVFFLNLDHGGDENIYLKVDFTDTLDVTEMVNSESIEMFGKSYTFDPNHAATDDLTLYGSDVTVVATQNEPQTIKMEDGKEYKVEVLGGNSGAETAIIRVTSGSTTDTKTMTAGSSRKMAGLDLFVEDVFISDIGESTISVSIFVGSEKIIIPNDAFSATCPIGDYEEITIGTNDDTEVYACIKGTNLTDVDGIYFAIDPTKIENDATDKKWDWLLMGEEFELPFFDFSLSFEGFVPSVESRPVVELTRSGDAYLLSFENNKGDEFEIELVYTDDGVELLYGYDEEFLGAGGASNISEDNYFILHSTASDYDDKVTYIFETTRVDDDDGVTLYELGTGSSKTYKVGKEILDTGVTIAAISEATETFTIAGGTTSNMVIAKGGLEVAWNGSQMANVTGGWLDVTFTEEIDDFDDVATGDFAVLGARIVAAGTDDIDMNDAAWVTTGANARVSDNDGDYLYGISEYGTWFMQETDDETDYLKVYYAGEETDFLVFLNGPDAVVVTGGSTAGGTAYVLNELVVGQIAIYDDEALSMIGRTPLLAVGGPCVNDVARELMGNPEVCAEGFTEGRAIIKLWESKNAILVAGYDGQDTTGGAQVLAAYKEYALSGTEVEVITTDLKNLEVKKVN